MLSVGTVLVVLVFDPDGMGANFWRILAAVLHDTGCRGVTDIIYVLRMPLATFVMIATIWSLVEIRSAIDRRISKSNSFVNRPAPIPNAASESN